MRLLIVEDSKRLRASLTHGLIKLGYAVDAAVDGEQALLHIASEQYDVVILDIMLPKLDGLSVLKKIRKDNNKSHVLILSAKDQVQDRIKGLDLGADDYLIKPFSFDELHARVCALVRRSYEHKNPLIRFASFEYNIALKELRHQQMQVALTPHELAILEYLLLNRGRVITYEQLELKIYNSDALISRNAVEAHISSIRKKLNLYHHRPVIKTRRSLGYYIEK